ncbi:MAG TPA: ATP-binding protein [Pseudomonadota bacterium]|nr:ATP-binding protein [Pseudomonadota bacterium]
MISQAGLIVVVLVYVGFLFLIAQVAERAAQSGRSWTFHSSIYSLGLAVYCTTWTYYGSVGKAATDGMLWLTIYLGPTLALTLAPLVLRSIVRIKARHKVTSIADFISARYGKSQAVAALCTVMLLIGIVPYLALQLKAVTGTFALMTKGAGAGEIISPIVIVLMFGFTVVFGIRRLDPTERHPGMMVSLAVESIVKLVAFLAAGAFVTWTLFTGPAEFLDKLAVALPKTVPFLGRCTGPQLLNWATYLLLATCAFMFLPRQFHVAVVENSDEKQLRTASWLSPLYLFLINIFVLPIALGGLLLAPKGISPDQYVLSLPMLQGHRTLSIFVFVGGFSAAIGMIMVETMTMATMVSNHLFLPLLDASPTLWRFRRHLLYARWFAAALLIGASYLFEVKVGRSVMLVSIGMLSFAAVTQFLPVMLGGLYWKEGNRTGALWGVGAGFLIWTYTLFLPTFVRSGWLPKALLTDGPFGIAGLRPEALFGLSGIPNLAHGTLWSLLFNSLGYVLGSLLSKTSIEERRLSEEFLGAQAKVDLGEEEGTLPLAEKVAAIETILKRYFSSVVAKEMVQTALVSLKLADKETIGAVELAELHRVVERHLGGSVGAAAAHSAMMELRSGVSAQESQALAKVYAKILASMNMAPSELRRKVDFYQERESLLRQQASELRQKMDALDLEVTERRKAEKALQELNEQLEGRVLERTKALKEAQKRLLDAAHRAGRAEIATNILHNVGNVLNSVNTSIVTMLSLFGKSRMPVFSKLAKLIEDKKKGDLGNYLSVDPKGKQVPDLVVALAGNLQDEQALLKAELEQLAKNIEHIKAIISVQQSHARASRVFETIDVRSLVDDAIRVNIAGLDHARIEVVRDYDDLPDVTLEKHKLLQILVNLISNARHAMVPNPPEKERVLRVSVKPIAGDRFRISVKDTGIGISAENLGKLFQHGFTTRSEGHGFGLHASSLAAKQMDGQVTAGSDGPGHGATFTVELPLTAEQKRSEDVNADASDSSSADADRSQMRVANTAPAQRHP